MAMKVTMLAAAAAGLVVAGCLCLCGDDYPESVDERFVSLFNGKDLSGWAGATGMYGVEELAVRLNDGSVASVPVLACFPERKAEGQAANLVTEGEYRNFVLRFEFLMPENGSGGLGIRIPGAEVDAAHGGMCELPLQGDGGSGVCKPGGWNFEEVKVVGGEIEVYLNGRLVTKGDLSKLGGGDDTPDGRKRPGLLDEKGRIGWCVRGGAVRWKNIRIRELPDDAKMGEVRNSPAMQAPEGFETCFDGCPKQLATKWKGVTNEDGFDSPIVRGQASAERRELMQKIADLAMRNHWSVRNGCLFFDGLRGGHSLATKRDYADFELWADWRLLSVTGDSGLSLRGVPEVQAWDARNQRGVGSGGLHNNEKNPARALKVADRPVGDWNRFHVIMRGDKVTVWLNGELVVDEVTLENVWDRSRPMFAKGQLELCGHGGPVEWGNVFVKEL